ncbi:hypothetical protein cyc_02093 [Cyclospora cayetanensis]|uniref:Uncharacterized protein n=1 Tax=Cyclospora cayetanensis TaxID=88456 RepID=A0A1D3CWN1_9EIME|nr:hypothetical protein cyc_02093 [Cyclospora cayetanensis]
MRLTPILGVLLATLAAVVDATPKGGCSPTSLSSPPTNWKASSRSSTCLSSNSDESKDTNSHMPPKEGVASGSVSSSSSSSSSVRPQSQQEGATATESRLVSTAAVELQRRISSCRDFHLDSEGCSHESGTRKVPKDARHKKSAEATPDVLLPKRTGPGTKTLACSNLAYERLKRVKRVNRAIQNTISSVFCSPLSSVHIAEQLLRAAGLIVKATQGIKRCSRVHLSCPSSVMSESQRDQSNERSTWSVMASDFTMRSDATDEKPTVANFLKQTLTCGDRSE